ncbi:uncharacterized protein LOC106068183 [Biomphalaria glabrata]|uniref:Uncharacterized protein LOC106068183 n=1 Tax=Biomphalaria glabrata TaxID=6526 RepID=A0A9W2YR47_BIOGL|nr:uncharacterized protein LOC106068183 [Biomphalaria glabrata]
MVGKQKGVGSPQSCQTRKTTINNIATFNSLPVRMRGADWLYWHSGKCTVGRYLTGPVGQSSWGPGNVSQPLEETIRPKRKQNRTQVKGVKGRTKLHWWGEKKAPTTMSLSTHRSSRGRFMVDIRTANVVQIRNIQEFPWCTLPSPLTREPSLIGCNTLHLLEYLPRRTVVQIGR